MKHREQEQEQEFIIENESLFFRLSHHSARSFRSPYFKVDTSAYWGEIRDNPKAWHTEYEPKFIFRKKTERESPRGWDWEEKTTAELLDFYEKHGGYMQKKPEEFRVLLETL